MSINPQQYAQNEAWILFQLNEDPVRTQMDGSFDVFAIMDVATGLIHGMEFVASGAEEISEFETKKLLNSAAVASGSRPKSLFVDAAQEYGRLKRTAATLGVKTIPQERLSLDLLTEEARFGFNAHVSRGK